MVVPWSPKRTTATPQGFDGAKKVTGRKRHILVDTLGLLLSVAVHSADIQDRDSACLVLDERTRVLWAAEPSEFRCGVGVAQGAGSSATERVPA